MDVNNNQNRMGQQNIDSNVYNYYGEKKIKKYLTTPFFPDIFLGREEELLTIRNKLFTDSNLLLLVNGMGGMGKTSLAAAYYRKHHSDYQHLAWLYVQTNIADALLTLKESLQITFAENTSPQQQLQILLDELRELRQPCLLVIDNANAPEDLQAQYAALHSCLNLHILITTRIKAFAKAAICPVGALPYEQALQLFTEHYPSHNATDDVLFEQVYNAVEGNTLIIELLAKNLQVMQDTHTDYGLAQLVADLQKGILQLTQTKAVESTYHADALFKANPLDIIAAMYDIGELAPTEKRLLSIMAVLPAESISFTTLQTLLPATEDLGDTLHSLSRKGWIAHGEKATAFKISPVIQEITRAKNEDLLGDCRELIAALKKKLENDTQHITGSSYTEAPLYMRYGESVLGHWEMDKQVFDLLLEKLGSCHAILGNLPKALHFYHLDAQLCQTLCDASPADSDWKNALGIAYSRLGNIYASMGNLPEALRFYQDETGLFQQLYDAYPDNVNFKNGLAISYEKLGQTYASMGNLPEALRFYQDETGLFQQLYYAYPDNVNFKNGLAISFSKLGQTYASMGNLPEALRFYQDATGLFQQLYDAYPDNVNFKNGLAVSFSKLGQTYADMGNLPEALRFYQLDADLTQQLYDGYPDNVNFKNGLAISYEKLGQTYASMGNLPEALRFYQDETGLFQQLYDAYPDHVNFKNGLAISFSKLGETYADMGNLPEALRFYQEETGLFQQLYEAYPDNVNFKNGLAISFSQLGQTYADMGNLPEALRFYQLRSTLGQQLYDAYPDNVNFKNGLAISYAKLGDFYKATDTDKARTQFEAAEKLWMELVSAAPQHAQFTQYLDLVRSRLADL